MCEGSDDVVLELPVQGLHAMKRGAVVALITAKTASHALQHRWVLDKECYPYTAIDGRYIRLHHFVWAAKVGHPPPFFTAEGLPGVVDHINRDRSDCRDCNLRCITTTENNQNRTYKPMECIRTYKDGTFGVEMTRHGEKLKIGGLASVEEARAVRDAHRF